jgi:hypothetical protein
VNITVRRIVAGNTTMTIFDDIAIAQDDIGINYCRFGLRGRVGWFN